MIILREGDIHVSVAAQKKSMNFQPQRVNVALKKTTSRLLSQSLNACPVTDRHSNKKVLSLNKVPRKPNSQVSRSFLHVS